MTRYRFDDVRAAVKKHWGLDLERPAPVESLVQDRHGKYKDGRWDTTHARSGYLLSGAFPGQKYGHRRYRTLGDVVRVTGVASMLPSHARTRR